jgi:hypothetical protein
VSHCQCRRRLRTRSSAIVWYAKPFRNERDSWATGFQEYLVDAFQRSVLFLDVLRRRGNEQKKISSHPKVVTPEIR